MNKKKKLIVETLANLCVVSMIACMVMTYDIGTGILMVIFAIAAFGFFFKLDFDSLREQEEYEKWLEEIKKLE